MVSTSTSGLSACPDSSHFQTVTRKHKLYSSLSYFLLVFFFYHSNRMKLELRCATNVSVTPVCILLPETHEGYADLVYFWCWVEDYDLRTVGAVVLLEGPTMPPSVRPGMAMADCLLGSHVAAGAPLMPSLICARLWTCQGSALSWKRPAFLPCIIGSTK